MKFVGSFFGVGLIPGAPGTYASALTVAVFFLLHRLAPWSGTPLAGFCLPAAAALLLGLVSIFAARSLPPGEKDPRWFVLDECSGQCLALVGVSQGNYWLGPLIVFGLFRLFDIIKPGPVRRLESLPAGWGILADDLAAGALACVCWHLSVFVSHAL
ncbi:MAG: phosphatidylglycerophosphatase A [Planctomycetes bacterium]|nr:phosphatidylglycerophosphatase A [Planctomycetota bacterium]